MVMVGLYVLPLVTNGYEQPEQIPATREGFAGQEIQGFLQPMNLSTYLLCNALFGILCIILAHKRKRSALKWFLLAIPFGVLPFFILLYLPDNPQNSDIRDRSDSS